jgi:hypothetical protein
MKSFLIVAEMGARIIARQSLTSRPDNGNQIVKAEDRYAEV